MPLENNNNSFNMSQATDQTNIAAVPKQIEQSKNNFMNPKLIRNQAKLAAQEAQMVNEQLK